MKTTRLARVAQTISGVGFPVAQQGNLSGDYPFLKVSDLARDENSEGVIGAANWVSSGQAKSLGGRVVPPESVIFPKVGAALHGNARGHVKTDVLIDNNMMAVVPHSIGSRFLYWWLRTIDLGDLSSGGTLPFVTDSSVRDLRVPIKSPAKQRRIADFLDDRVSRIDRIIAARRKQVTMSSKAFDARWDAEMSQLAERYSTVPMRRVLSSIVDGPFGSSLTSKHYSDSGTRVIRLGNIGVASFRDHDQAFIPDEYATTLSSHAVEPGDLVMAGLGDERWPLGRCAVIPDIGPAIVKADCYRIRLTSDVDHQFAAVALSSPLVRSRMSILGRGATRARLNTEVAREAPVVVPPFHVQRDWTQRWHRQRSEVEQLNHAFQRSINILTEYKSSLITAAVTGELDVTTAGSNIPG